MKNTLLFFLLCLTSIMAAQSRQDTVYSRWGQIQNVKFYSKMDVDVMTKSARFQRGLSYGDEVWELDSIRVHDTEGQFVRTRIPTDLDPVTRVPAREKRATEKQVRKFSEHFSTADDVVNIAGYAGAQATGTLKFRISGNEAIPFRPDDLPDNVKLEMSGKTYAPGNHELTISVALKPGVSQHTLRFNGPGQEVYDIRLALRGHDLTEADFVPNSDEVPLKQLDAREREHLYLRLEGTEKLLILYQGEQLRYRFPVGRQLDQIPVYHLTPGEYRMEIVDLGSGKKRSMGLLR